MKDKYSAIWISHSSMTDYLKCPRSYFLKNIYRNPKTHHKISLMKPSLALGQVVHDVIEKESTTAVEQRLKISIMEQFDERWQLIAGKKGGFFSVEEEEQYKQRGRIMIQQIIDHPGPIGRKAIKIRQELPYFWLSEEDNIILCGKIDWLEYIEHEESVRIIDFKTGKYDEDPDSLQLPIYVMLAQKCQKYPVKAVAYWYLDRDPEPTDIKMPDVKKSESDILEIGHRISLARKVERFMCKQKDGCNACRPFEQIIQGKALFVGENERHQDVYVQMQNEYLSYE